MPETTGYKKGDWVRFYRDGKLVIGQVEYLDKDVIGHWYLNTDAGRVREDSVLEAREGK